MSGEKGGKKEYIYIPENSITKLKVIKMILMEKL